MMCRTHAAGDGHWHCPRCGLTFRCADQSWIVNECRGRPLVVRGGVILAILRALRWTLRNRRLPWLTGRDYTDRLAICRANTCGQFDGRKCTACGCGVGGPAPEASGARAILGRWLDKPRWPAESCPVGLWQAK